MQPLISVVVCTYNRAEMLGGPLESVIFQETDERFSYEIVVIDDGSTDGTENVVKEIIKKTHIVPIRYVYKEGGGIADARNRGVAEAKGKWIAFIDDDRLAEPQWLVELYKVAIEREADCVGGTCLIDLPDSNDLKFGPFCRSTLGELLLGDEPRRYPMKVGLGTGNVLIRRKLFESIGVFDASLLMGGEDADFFCRCDLHGAEMWCAPKAIVHHIIPERRLRYRYFKQQSLYFGISCARIRYKYRGRLRWFLALGRWVFRSLACDVWLLLIALLLRNRSRQLEQKSKLWCTLGYVRGSLHLLAPSISRQKSFFQSLDFRKRADE
jgi:glycosyltransferase involved in cell wall biosynthesis